MRLVLRQLTVKSQSNASLAQLVERDLAKVEVTSSNLVTRSNSSEMEQKVAGWQSGHAADCKSVHLGSTPGPASINTLTARLSSVFARVVKSVDTRDLKSLGGNPVPVQVRPRAPFNTNQTY